MSNFNTKRFIQTLKWSAMATKKEIATIAGCMFFLYMVPFIMSVISTQGEPDIVADASIENATLVCTFFFGVYTMISGCWIMNNMKTKEQRITFKMLPASDLEKFIVRALYITVVWMLIGVVAFCLADFCRMLICFISGSHGTYSTIPDVLNMWFGPADTHSMRMTAWRLDFIAGVLAVNAWVFWAHSFYVLGGAFFRRRQFILTSCAHFALGILSLIIISYIPKESIFLSIEKSQNLVNTIAYVYTAVAIMVGLLNWWLTYRLFKHSQVINNKWINL